MSEKQERNRQQERQIGTPERLHEVIGAFLFVGQNNEFVLVLERGNAVLEMNNFFLVNLNLTESAGVDFAHIVCLL